MNCLASDLRCILCPRVAFDKSVATVFRRCDISDVSVASVPSRRVFVCLPGRHDKMRMRYSLVAAAVAGIPSCRDDSDSDCKRGNRGGIPLHERAIEGWSREQRTEGLRPTRKRAHNASRAHGWSAASASVRSFVRSEFGCSKKVDSRPKGPLT